MIENLKVKAKKLKLQLKSQKFLVLSFGFALYALSFTLSTAHAFAQDATSPATPSATTPSDSVRDKVRKTIESLTRKPRAVVGNLSDIADTTLQIKTRSNESIMVSVTKDTSYVRMNQGKKTDIKFSELVLGDFTIAMGTRNGNNVLEATRIITYDKNPLKVRRAVYGTVSQNKNGVLTVSLPKSGEAWTIKTSSKTNITANLPAGKAGMTEVKANSIEVGARIVAVGTPDEKQTNTLLASLVHVIPVH